MLWSWLRFVVARAGSGRIVVQVLRLRASVGLDDPEPVLARAEAQAAAGDESWARWIEEYRRGAALIVRLTVTLEVMDGDREVVEATNRGIFLEKDRHAPKVEQQVAELAGKDFSLLARELAARGYAVDDAELHASYVHVDLGDDVRRCLADAAAPTRAHGPDRPRADIRLSEDERPPEQSR